MFAKMKAKPTLVETYEEAERVEAKRESVEDYPDLPGEKTIDRRDLLLSLVNFGSNHLFLTNVLEFNH